MNTTAGWMLFSLVIGGVVVLAALAAHDAQRAANRAVRWVWFAAILLTVGLSLSAPLRRLAAPTRIAVDGIAVAMETLGEANAARSTGFNASWTRLRDAVAIPVNAAMQVVVGSLDRVPTPVQQGLAALWLLATLATLGVFGVSYARMRQRLRAWPTQRVADIDARISPDAGPAVVGLVPSEIVLPSWLLGCPPGEQRLVIAHESEHVRAGDPWLLVIACGAIVCMPWNPALWFALGRLRLAIELDCDQRVLRRGVPALAYGSLLIDLSALRSSLPSAMPAFSCNGSFLERRLVAMTSRPTRFSQARRLVGAAIAACALITACESKLPTSAEVESMDVASAEAQAQRISLVDSGRSVYVVDGKAVSLRAAREIEASRIASVKVLKRTGTALSEVQVSTKDTLLLRKVPMDLSQQQELELAARQARMRDTSGAVVRLRQSSPKRTFDGLLLVDGKITDASALQRMSPESIEAIEVVKGAEAQRRYSDPRAAHGVILVTTKVKP